MPRWLGFLAGICLLLSCHREEKKEAEFPALMEIPNGFPEIEMPEDNGFTEQRWKLGKKLFYDPILSSDRSISCASCHLPQYAFSDIRPVSPGVEARPGMRNVPTLANVAYHPYYTRDGGVPTLEMQVLVPIQEHNEFDFNMLLIAERLNEDSTYIALADSAYERAPDAFVITRALACFERSLLSGWSAYDRFLYAGQTDALTASAQRGMSLFFGDRLQCSQCHGGFNFTNYEFENNGLYEVYADEGRYRLTHLEEDKAKFKVPGLRNIALTAPYMHDGSLQDLPAVIEHYNTGGYNHPNKNPRIKPLYMCDDEKADLLHFLASLTDESFVNNPIFSP